MQEMMTIFRKELLIRLILGVLRNST